MSVGELRRGSAIPLYFQLQEILKERIETGTWGPGALMPSEPELCDAYEVSRTVVRQALAVLEQDGQVRRVRGRGTFVTTPKIEQRVGGISRLLATPDPRYELVVLDHREQVPPKRIRDQLQLRSTAKILRVMSLLHVTGLPVTLLDSFFPLATSESLRKQLRKTPPIHLQPTAQTRAVDFTGTTVGIETSFCSPWEAEQLQIPLRGAVFVTLCTEFGREGNSIRPLEVVRAVYRVDRVQLRFDVSSDGEVPAALWQLSDG